MKKIQLSDALVIMIVLLLAISSIVGVCSFDTTKSYMALNQYGERIQMWGKGIYSHDSYFKAPIFIGTDVFILVLVIPMTIVALIKEIKSRTMKSKLLLMSINGISLYYAASIAFGVTYNGLLLIYIALFGLTFFAMVGHISEISRDELHDKSDQVKLTRGLSIFLLLSGVSLFVAWLPDIIPTYFTGNSLSLIEVYTTEITYVLDMAIVCPIIFICLYQLKHQIEFGKILLVMILKTCELIGIMVIFQTLFQVLSGIYLPLPVLIIKAGIFVVLSTFALYYEQKFYKGISE